MIAGLRIIEDISMTKIVEDWSRVRSRSRAARRRAKHRQNIVMRVVPSEKSYRVGDTLIMHPEMAAKLRRSVALKDFSV